MKALSEIFKPFEGFQKELGKEIPFFILGIAMDSSKGLGWKGAIFALPFAIAFLVSGFLILRNILVFFF